MPGDGPIKILLADDDGDDRALFEGSYARRTGIVILPSAVNGLDVIKMLNATDDDEALPDLIILDQNMPLMNGKQTLIWLKSNPRYTNIPVCIYSTYADKPLIESCRRLGAFNVLSKPITEDEYQQMMDEFLSVFK